MRSNELRIGNWVQCAIIKIGSLKKGDFHQVEIDDFNYNLEDYFRPIPLTEEWLIKFGFVREGMLTMRLDKFTCYCEEDDYIDNFCLGHIELFDVVPKYVHQLQNLYFALTGKELTIKE